MIYETFKCNFCEEEFPLGQILEYDDSYCCKSCNEIKKLGLKFPEKKEFKDQDWQLLFDDCRNYYDLWKLKKRSFYFSFSFKNFLIFFIKNIFF